MRLPWLCVVFLAPATAHGAANAPAASVPTRNSIELAVFGGYSRIISKIDHTRESAAFNGGSAIAGTVLYRSPYFLSPFVDVGYYPLYASRDKVDVASAGGTIRVASALSASGFMVGPAVDLWRFRLKWGVGVFNVNVRSTALGNTSKPDEIDFGYMLALSGFFLRSPRIQVGGEARAGIIVEADKAFVALGFTIAGQAITW
jgi:hypothetical protein